MAMGFKMGASISDGYTAAVSKNKGLIDTFVYDMKKSRCFAM